MDLWKGPARARITNIRIHLGLVRDDREGIDDYSYSNTNCEKSKNSE